MLRSSSLLIACLGGIALGVACASSEDAGDSDDGENTAGMLAGGQSNQGGASASAPSGGTVSNAGSSGVSAQAGRSAGLAGKDASESPSGGASGVIPAGGAGGEVELPAESSACVNTSPSAGSEDSAGLVLKLKANSDRAQDFTQGEVQISNESSAGIALAALELRYYFQSEYEPEQTDKLVVKVDHAQKSGRVYTNIAQNLVSTDVVLVDPAAPGADAFIRISFPVGIGQDSMLLAGETVLVQFRIEPPDNSYYQITRDQTNDYSFGACPTYASPWSRMILLKDGRIVSGELPEGLPTPSAGAGGQGGAGGESPAGGASGSGGAEY